MVLADRSQKETSMQVDSNALERVRRDRRCARSRSEFRVTSQRL